MEENTAIRRLAAACVVALLASACSEDPDPRAVAMTIAPTPVVIDVAGPRVQTADYLVGDGSMPQPAPLGETSLQRFEVQQRRTSLLALGRVASEFVGPNLEHQLELLQPDVDCQPMTLADRDAVELMIGSRAEAALVACPVTARDIRSGLRPQRIAAEVYVLAVQAHFPLRSLTRQQMRQVLTGEVRDWRKVGGPTATISVAMIDGRGFAERAARVLVPGDKVLQASLRRKDDADVLDIVRGTFGAVGLVRLGAAEGVAGVQLLAIDAIEPSTNAYTEGYYNFGMTLFVVGNGAPNGAAALLLRALRDPTNWRGGASALTLLP